MSAPVRVRSAAYGRMFPHRIRVHYTGHGVAVRRGPHLIAHTLTWVEAWKVAVREATRVRAQDCVWDLELSKPGPTPGGIECLTDDEVDGFYEALGVVRPTEAP